MRTESTVDRVVVVGAGQAGSAACATLRQYGWTGPIALVGEEPLPPYQRPPLSKAWLKGPASLDSLLLRPLAFYEAQKIDLCAGASVAAIERERREVVLANGKSLAYTHLVLALGAHPRMPDIPGADLAGIHRLRTVADADALKEGLGEGRQVVILGGGYIGLEVAASARAMGGDVTVIEREKRLLPRVASSSLSNFFEAQHRARGVKFVFGSQAKALVGGKGRVAGVRLDDGRELACDVVVVGIGAKPNDSLARHAGIVCKDGILVDGTCRTSDPAIFAIGDCSQRPLPLYGRTLRLESVANAIEQAKQAAAEICGRAPPAVEVPWFWSTQYDLRLQIAGLLFDVADSVVSGSSASNSFAIFHFSSEGRLQAVEAVNRPSDFVLGRKLILSRIQSPPAKLLALTAVAA